MSGLNFDAAFSGIFAGQRAIKIAQNNIANINTEGYARQKMNLVANTSVAGAGVDMQIGNGVVVQQVERIKDDFLISQSRGEQGILGYYQGMREALGAIETVFNENSDGSVSQLLAKFFNSWDELSKFPEENSYRNALIATAENLAKKLNDVNSGLNQMEAKMDTEIEFQVKKINELVEKVVSVNEKISRITTENPNSLYDERDRYLDELSSYIDISVIKDIKNPMLVHVKVGGVTLVSGTQAREIETMFDTQANQWLLTTGSSVMHSTGGAITANLEMRNEKIAHYKQQLDQFVSAIITEVNAVHATGYGLDGSTGNDFFLGTSLHNIEVNPLFKGNPEKIATSSKLSTPGNSDIAKSIAGLKDANILSSGTINPIRYYNGFAIELATQLNIVADNASVHENILMNIESERQSVQGVSMDEELANLLRYEQYYAANSKVVTTVDKLYDVLLQMF